MRERILRASFHTTFYLLLLTACMSTSEPISSRIIIDWAPFITFNGTTYMLAAVSKEHPLQPDDIGPVFATVQFMLADNVDNPEYRAKDGDAAFLPTGTPVFTLKGYAARFRLAAWQGGQIVLFEADTNPTAQHGVDLLDIDGKVDYIGINSETDGTTELAAIKDPHLITDLVAMIMNAPIDQSSRDRGNNNEPYFVALHLKDKTVVNRAFWPSSGELSRGIMLPDEWSQVVRQAVKK